MPLADLTALARVVRDGAHGRRVTFSPKVFIPLTMLCRDRCGYCTFAKAPARLAVAVPDARRGARRRPRRARRRAATRRCSPWASGPSCATRWRATGWPRTATPRRSTTSPRCAASSSRRPACSPTPTPARCSPTSWPALRAVSASQGMMLESLAEGLAAHRGAPDKEPARRLATLEAAGELAIPFTTGILVGIGDDRAGQLAALRAIAASHGRHGHVQEVIVQNFLPKPGTAMAKAAPCPPRTCSGPSRRPAWCCRPRSTCRRRPTSPTTWRRCSTPGSTTGAACRRSRPTT